MFQCVISLISCELSKFYRTEYFQIYIFYSLVDTYSNKQIFNSNTTSISTIQLSAKQVIMKFIKIEINKRWSEAYQVYCSLIHILWSMIHQNLTAPAINFCLMNPDNYAILYFFIKYLGISAVGQRNCIVFSFFLPFVCVCVCFFYITVTCKFTLLLICKFLKHNKNLKKKKKGISAMLLVSTVL